MVKICYNKKIIKIITILFLYYLLSFYLLNIKIGNVKKYYCKKQDKSTKFISDKWIVITTINSPSPLIFKLLLKITDTFKIVVIGDIKTNDEEWKKLKFKNKLIYLSIKDQLNLCYNIIKYIPFNSYSRKNIGYLYAIDNGAKEIYEIDDNINNNNLEELNNIFKVNGNYDKFSVIKSNRTQMINPYYYFGLRNIWPRGFRLGDIGKDSINEFINVILTQTNIKPLVYQRLINGEPDIDSLFLQTRIKNNSMIDIYFSKNNPLLYLPGNYIPINSKNTKYLYDVFPTLPLFTTVNKKVSDIWRGFIMQKYIWGYNGVVLFDYSSSYKKSKLFLNNSEFLKDKNLYYNLDIFLNILEKDLYKDINNQKTFLITIIENLVNNKIIKENDLNMYKAFIQDLSYIGYKYSSKYKINLNYNYKNFLNLKSEFIKDIRFQYKIILFNNIKSKLKLIYHKLSNKKFNDILLVINYNYNYLFKLNKYMIQLYRRYFPQIVFINPEYDTDNNNTVISCPESNKGFYAYMCFRKVYNKFQNMKGYLIINDDNFLKSWELENFDYNIPWFNNFHIFQWNNSLYNYTKLSILTKTNLKNLDTAFNRNLEWKKNITQFIGHYAIAKALVDNVYFPNSMFNKFIEIIEQMYKMNIFIEFAIPNVLGIMLLPKYKITSILAIWGRNRRNIIKYLKENNDYYFIHPIKLSKQIYWKEINLYIYFINAEDF